jgi:hypothetical protein
MPDDIATCSACRKIVDARSPGPILDDNGVIPAAEKEIAGEGPTLAENEHR